MTSLDASLAVLVAVLVWRLAIARIPSAAGNHAMRLRGLRFGHAQGATGLPKGGGNCGLQQVYNWCVEPATLKCCTRTDSVL